MHQLDVGQRVAELEAHYAKTQEEVKRMTARCAVLGNEVNRLDATERRTMSELVTMEENTLLMAFEYGQRTDDIDALNALVQVLRAHAANEQLRLLDAERDLDAYREGVALELQTIHNATAELRQRLAEHKAESTAWDNQTKRQRSEILRLQQERLELEARTETSLLQHAREVFRV
jgi:chromosome segregation ATPase